MFVRFTALLVVFSLLNIPSGYAGRFPFELAGQYDDEIIRPEVRERFGLRKAVSLNERGVFTNARFFFGVDDSESAQSDRYPVKPDFPQIDSRSVHWFNVRGRELPDYPINWTAFMLQWLYPSSAGYQLTVNQGLDFDPVRAFTPITIGRILDSLNGFTVQNHESWDSFKNVLVDDIESTLPKRSKRSAKRRRALTVQFVDSFIAALNEQVDREESGNTLYPSAFLENALFNFALEKAVAGSNPSQEMTDFYNAMPSVVVDGWQPLAPFDQDGYKALMARIKGGNLELEPREQFYLLCGLSAFSRLFPEQVYYSNANYEGTQFPNCGEASLLNVINGFLWSFGDKRLRTDILEKIPSMNPALIQYFVTYPTTDDQQAPEGLQDWTNLVSGLTGQDIVYKKGGICEITGGTISMAGVLRALIGDDRFKEISTLGDITPLERAKLTFDHFAEIFSIEGEEWTWEVGDAEEDEEQTLKSNLGFTINFSKQGDNTLIIDDEVYEGELISWEFKPGHFEASFTEKMGAKFLAPWVDAALRHDMDIASRGALSMGLNPMELWAMTKYWNWDHIVMVKLGLLAFDEELEEQYPELKIAPLLSSEYFAQFMREGLESSNYRNNTARLTAFVGVSKANAEDLYLFASNLYTGMPAGNIDSIRALLPLLVDESGQLKDGNAVGRVHPRLLKSREEVLTALEDATQVYECLESGANVGEFIFLMNKIPPGSLDKSQTLKLFDSMIEELDYTPELWSGVFEKFGNVFANTEGIVDATEFMTYKSSKSALSFVSKLFVYPDIKVLEWFIEQGYVTRDLLLEVDADGESPVTLFRGSWYRVPRLLLLCSRLGVTKEDLRKVDDMTFVHMFIEETGENQDYQAVIDALSLDKEDFLCPVADIDEDTVPGVLVQMTMDASLLNRLKYLLDVLGITPDDTPESMILFPSALNHVDYLLENGFLNREMYFDESKIISAVCNSVISDHFQRLRLISAKLNITKEDLGNLYHDFFFNFFSMDHGEDSDYQGVIDYFGLTKEDFLKPTNSEIESADLHVGSLFQIYNFDPQLGDRIRFLVRALGITSEDIVEAGKDFVAIEEPRTTWDVYFMDHFPILFPAEPRGISVDSTDG